VGNNLSHIGSKNILNMITTVNAKVILLPNNLNIALGLNNKKHLSIGELPGI
jgi:hypothetical protein